MGVDTDRDGKIWLFFFLLSTDLVPLQFLLYATLIFVFLLRDISQCLHSTFHPWKHWTPSIAKFSVSIFSNKHLVRQFSGTAPRWFRQRLHSTRWWRRAFYPRRLSSTTSSIWETCRTSSRYFDGPLLWVLGLGGGMILVIVWHSVIELSLKLCYVLGVYSSVLYRKLLYELSMAGLLFPCYQWG